MAKNVCRSNCIASTKFCDGLRFVYNLNRLLLIIHKTPTTTYNTIYNILLLPSWIKIVCISNRRIREWKLKHDLITYIMKKIVRWHRLVKSKLVRRKRRIQTANYIVQTH